MFVLSLDETGVMTELKPGEAEKPDPPKMYQELEGRVQLKRLRNSTLEVVVLLVDKDESLLLVPRRFRDTGTAIARIKTSVATTALPSFRREEGGAAGCSGGGGDSEVPMVGFYGDDV